MILAYTWQEEWEGVKAGLVQDGAVVSMSSFLSLALSFFVFFVSLGSLLLLSTLGPTTAEKFKFKEHKRPALP
jgi:hypothetical protein